MAVNDGDFLFPESAGPEIDCTAVLLTGAAVESGGGLLRDKFRGRRPESAPVSATATGAGVDVAADGFEGCLLSSSSWSTSSSQNSSGVVGAADKTVGGVVGA